MRPLLRYGDGFSKPADTHSGGGSQQALQADVKRVQTRLQVWGYDVVVDGEFGHQTRSSVQSFQSRHGLDVDGIVGPATWTALLGAPPLISNEWPDKIVRLAHSHLGQREKPNNSGFVDSAFERMMRAFGWYKDAAWCAFEARAVWLAVYADHPGVTRAIRSTLGGGCVESWRRASAEGSPLKTGKKARRGAIGYMQYSRTTGHAYTVMSDPRLDGTFATSEGNSNRRGGREGIEVAEFANKRSEHDPRLLGFVYPPDPQEFER